MDTAQAKGMMQCFSENTVTFAYVTVIVVSVLIKSILMFDTKRTPRNEIGLLWYIDPLAVYLHFFKGLGIGLVAGLQSVWGTKLGSSLDSIAIWLMR